MKKRTTLTNGILTMLFVFLGFASPVFAQVTPIEEMPVEEVEEVEIEEDSIVVVTPSDIPEPPQAELIPNVPDELIADRLSCLEKQNGVKLTYNKTIRSFIDYFTIRNRNYTLVMERRKNLYFPIFEEYLKKHNMPDELKYLAIVESGLNPRAMSRVGAAGLWQFMPGTGREFRLYQDSYLDERLDPYEATEAACKYLKQLYSIFDDWQLALASYNCGPGNVRKAIRQSGYKDDFWEIYNYLPKETRGYVPQFVAVTYSMNYMKEHNLVADSLEYPMVFETINSDRNVNLDKLCEHLNICSEDLQKLNPGLKKNIVPAHINYPIRIPADKYEFFAANRDMILDSCSKDCEKEIVIVKTEMITSKPQQRKIIYTVKRGDALGKIAAKHGVTLANIRSWNKIKGNTIRQGQRLVIYKKGTASTSQAPTLATSSSKQSSTSTKSSSKSKVYYVQPGDTLWSISKKSNLTIQELKQKNNLKGNEIKVGMKLII
jgi:membrane-bound lytic murein transglycosylase D